MCDGKSTREYLHDLHQEHVSTHCRMTNKNLWIEREFKVRSLNKSFTGNTTKIKANLNVKKKKKKSPVILGIQSTSCVASIRIKHL